MTDDTRYYYGFRQTTPKPIARWILCGGKRDWDDAKAEHNNSYERDCELSPLFVSASREEAQSRIDAMNFEGTRVMDRSRRQQITRNAG